MNDYNHLIRLLKKILQRFLAEFLYADFFRSDSRIFHLNKCLSWAKFNKDILTLTMTMRNVIDEKDAEIM